MHLVPNTQNIEHRTSNFEPLMFAYSFKSGNFYNKKQKFWVGPVVEESLNWNRIGGNSLFGAALFFNKTKKNYS